MARCTACVEEGVALLRKDGDGDDDLLPSSPVHLQARSPQACRNICHEEEQCRSWTMDRRRRLCYLKHSSFQAGAGGARQRNHSNFVSGVKVCEDWRAFKAAAGGRGTEHSGGGGRGNLSQPLVTVLRRSGGASGGGLQSALLGIPASFGQPIRGDFAVSASMLYFYFYVT